MQRCWERAGLINGKPSHYTRIIWDDELPTQVEIQLTAYTYDDCDKPFSISASNLRAAQDGIAMSSIWFGHRTKTLADIFKLKRKFIINYCNPFTETSASFIARVGELKFDAFNVGLEMFFTTSCSGDKDRYIWLPNDAESLSETISKNRELELAIEDIKRRLQTTNANVYRSNYIASRAERRLSDHMSEMNMIKRWSFWQRLKWLFFGY